MNALELPGDQAEAEPAFEIAPSLGASHFPVLLPLVPHWLPLGVFA